MAQKLIAVIGATGNQGGSVVDTFLSAGWNVRGITRNVDSPASTALKYRGVEMVSANLDSIPSLIEAFTGANAIFSVTDFWTGFRNPSNRSKLSPRQTLLEWTHDYDMQQGKNIFTAAARTQGLERLVFSALPYASKWSGGKYKHVYHFDCSARAVEWAQAELPELMKKTSVIALGMYLSNTLLMPHYQPKKDKDDVYVFETTLPDNCKIPLVAADEDTGPLTKALVDAESGKHLLAYRDKLSFAEYAEVWGRVMGVNAKHVVSDGEWGSLPKDIRLDIEDAAKYLVEFGYDGGDPSVIHPTEVGVKLGDLGTVEDWIRKQDWSTVL